MRVIFSHGKESGPWGSKITRLAEVAKQRGYQVESIDYRDLSNPDQRVERLSAALQDDTHTLLVGSSMGGYVSAVTAMDKMVDGVFLLAPAFYLEGYRRQEIQCLTSNVHIVHGWQDDIIPYQHSVTFARQQKSTLHLLSGDHRLNAALPIILPIFDQFLQQSVQSTNC